MDVGGARKGFDAAIVTRDRIVAGPQRRLRTAEDVIEWLSRHDPRVIGIDSPRTVAPDGALSRRSERELRKAVCGIRYTPHASLVEDGGSYYDWIRPRGARAGPARPSSC